MSSREQKNEFWRLRKEIKSEYQPVCGNCGSIENIEFHHVVPLEFGGRNVITNIVPLCHQCHCLAHQKVGRKKIERAGRPRKDAPKGYKEAIDRYIRGELKGVLSVLLMFIVNMSVLRIILFLILLIAYLKVLSYHY